MQALNDGSPMAAKPLFDVTPLVPRLERGDTVLTANHRLARYIQRAWDERQRAAGARAWATAADREVNSTQAREVATATAVTSSGGRKSSRSSRTISSGTITTPPPMPSSPPRNPLSAPMPTQAPRNKKWFNYTTI